jgi:hypothetical protein
VAANYTIDSESVTVMAVIGFKIGLGRIVRLKISTPQPEIVKLEPHKLFIKAASKEVVDRRLLASVSPTHPPAML